MCADNTTSISADVMSDETYTPDFSILSELGSSDQVHDARLSYRPSRLSATKKTCYDGSLLSMHDLICTMCLRHSFHVFVYGTAADIYSIG